MTSSPPKTAEARHRGRLRQGATLELTIDRLRGDGDGVAIVGDRPGPDDGPEGGPEGGPDDGPDGGPDDGPDGVPDEGGLEVVVPGAFPGEVAEVVIDHLPRSRSRAFARVVRLLRRDPGRRRPPCDNHAEVGGRCTGCPWQGVDEATQRALKRRLLAEVYGLEVDEVVALPAGELGYRASSKRVVGGRPGALTLGSYIRGSHRFAAMTGCLVDHPLIVAAAHELEAVASELGIVPAISGVGGGEGEGTGNSNSGIDAIGDLRYVWFKTDGRRVLLTLVTRGTETRVAELSARLQLPSGVAWSVQESPGNAIRGAAATLLRGDPALALRLAGVTTEVGPLGFLQPNPAVAELAYRDLVRGPDGVFLGGEGRGEAEGEEEEKFAIDLYAGAGVTTALLRQRFARVIAVEAYPESAHALGVVPMTAEEFLRGFLRGYRGSPPALVVANPPRAGLGAAVCRALGELGPERIQIMSCAPKTLARDLETLAAVGYRRCALRAYDTLPQTPHVEVIAWLRRG